METVKAKSEYDIQAEKFLIDCGATIKAEFLYHGPYFDDDKEARDVYRITIERSNPSRQWSFKFGQSINNSCGPTGQKIICPRSCMHYSGYCFRKDHTKRRTAPSVYDVLACVQKYDAGTFADFCADFGYSEDSIKAQKTYFAVQEEWSNVRKMFGDVIEKLQEIQ